MIDMDSESLEQLLNDLPPGSWNVEQFVEASRQFAPDHGVELSLFRVGHIPPKIPYRHGFKYWSAYDEAVDNIRSGDQTTVLACAHIGGELVGFAIGAIKKRESELQILSVHHNSTRRSGISRPLRIGPSEFTVGVGHLVALQLLAALPRPVSVKATTSSSRYICKSLGFVRLPKPSNGHRLRLG